MASEKVQVTHLHFASVYQHHFTLLRWIYQLPYVLTLHRGDVLNFHKQPAVDRWLIRRVVANAAAVVAVSGFLAKETAEVFAGKIMTSVIKNGIDTRWPGPQEPPSLPFALPPRFMLMVANVTL